MSTPNENFNNQCNLNNSNIDILPTLSETPTTAIETNPTIKMDSTSKNVDTTSCNDESNLTSNQQQQEQEKPAQESITMQSPGDKDDSNHDTNFKGKDENADDTQTQQQNDSSTFSTAFTISFEDDTNTSKKLGIKDSIRKFAPPKPHTIEKPRQPKSNDQNNQDHSLISVESAPAGLSKHSNRKGGGCSNSSRSSSRKSNSSRHSNISESAAFLIDKMLNCKQPDTELVELSPRDRQHKQHKHGSGSGSKSQHAKSPTSQGGGGSKKVQPKRLTHSSDDILDSELDFCEDRSDNGTYIVGADPESEAARKKIDELFGVVKAAEASVLAESRSRGDKTAGGAIGGRQSRLTDKKPLNRERQEHINRLAYRNSSRSSSSSRQDNHNHHQPRSSSRHNHNSRNSSCERTPRASGGGGGSARPRRSASQSSRQSSNKEPSDGDTRSSRSSLHNDADLVSNHESSISNHPSMKFNRAFALRRARLGLGEPVRVTQQQHPNQNYSQQQEMESTTAAAAAASVNNMSSSQRRHQINSNTYRASQQQHHQQQQQQQQGHSTSSGSANFCRDDGGRFSLRMKNNALPSRLSSSANVVPVSGRSPQHLGGGGGSALIDSYINKVSSGGGKNSGPANVLVGALVQHQQQQENQRNFSSPKHLNQSSCSSSSTTGVPFQSDEPEIMSHSRYRLFKAGRLPKKGLSDLEASDTDSYANYHQRFNYSLNNSDCYEATNNSYSLVGECSRANSSVGSKQQQQQQQQRGSNLQLGALDSLVISAISSLSLKIRDSVCEVLVDHAKKLPIENETRLIVEEILPQLTTNPSSSKSPTSIEEIDQSLYFDLAKTLKNLKKVEQMVDVINHISSQLPASSSSASSPATINQIATSISSTSSVQHHQHQQQQQQQHQQHQQHNNNLSSSFKSSSGHVGSTSSIVRATSDSATNSDINSVNDLSPV